MDSVQSKPGMGKVPHFTLFQIFVSRTCSVVLASDFQENVVLNIVLILQKLGGNSINAIDKACGSEYIHELIREKPGPILIILLRKRGRKRIKD
jgi:hypothetical protein